MNRIKIMLDLFNLTYYRLFLETKITIINTSKKRKNTSFDKLIMLIKYFVKFKINILDIQYELVFYIIFNINEYFKRIIY